MVAVRETRILCWNVNGVRAAKRVGFLDWLAAEAPDIHCLQETKAVPEQLDDELREPPGYRSYWNHSERKGYSGVATFFREEPVCARHDFGPEGFDTEGRALLTDHGEFALFNVYFPNGKKGATRLRYKLDFYDAFLDAIECLRTAGRELVICGDFNTAHHEIDLARPKENAKTSGFLPSERAWMDRHVGLGYVDTFRHFCGEPGQYTWWDVKTRARERNVGWRLDYFFVTPALLPAVSRAFIMPDVMGSDHCPIGLVLQTP